MKGCGLFLGWCGELVFVVVELFDVTRMLGPASWNNGEIDGLIVSECRWIERLEATANCHGRREKFRYRILTIPYWIGRHFQ
jgi:hypothetical protein